MATHDFVIGQTDHLEADIPKDMNVFDIFFDVNSGAFASFKHVYNYIIDEKGYERPKKNLLAVTVSTTDLLRINFVLDRFVEIEKPVMLLGPTAQGKSVIMRNYVYEKDSPVK